MLIVLFFRVGRAGFAFLPGRFSAGLIIGLICGGAHMAGALERSVSDTTLTQGAPLALTVHPDRAAYRPGEPIVLTLRFANSSQQGVPLLIGYRTSEELHYDQLQIAIQDTSSDRHWAIVPVDVRRGVQPVGCVIAPGATLTQTLDLTHWLKRTGADLAAGQFAVTVTYHAGARALAAHHSPICAPLLGHEGPTTTDDGTMLHCFAGPLRSQRAALRIRAQ